MTDSIEGGARRAPLLFKGGESVLYIDAGGVRLFYEVCGSGSPVVLVHGNGESHDIFSRLAGRLSEKHTVYSVDSRCHGKSDDTDAISYDLMAEDMIAFIERLGIEKPVYYGFSDGGITGLKVAIMRPELLSRLIISGANLNPGGLGFFTRLGIKLVYRITGDRLYGLMVKEPDITAAELAQIAIPVNVIAGEKDVVKRSHTEFIAASLKNSTLEIVPGEKHGSYIVNSDKIFHIIAKYIE